MRKIKLIAGLIILSVLSLSAQETLSFEKVIKTDSVGKKIIFTTINDWFATTYNSSKNVIQMNDKDAGIIIGKGLFEYNSAVPMFERYSFDGDIKYTIKVYVKDNRYKVILTDFNHSAKNIIDKKFSPYSFGIITTKDVYKKDESITDVKLKYYQLKINQNWNDIKLKCKQYSDDIFTSLENKTKNLKVEATGDDW